LSLQLLWLLLLQLLTKQLLLLAPARCNCWVRKSRKEVFFCFADGGDRKLLIAARGQRLPELLYRQPASWSAASIDIALSGESKD
jgi:hypothetical protein